MGITLTSGLLLIRYLPPFRRVGLFCGSPEARGQSPSVINDSLILGAVHTEDRVALPVIQLWHQLVESGHQSLILDKGGFLSLLLPRLREARRLTIFLPANLDRQLLVTSIDRGSEQTG